MVSPRKLTHFDFPLDKLNISNQAALLSTQAQGDIKLEALHNNPFGLAPLQDEKLSFIGSEEDLARHPDILNLVNEKDIVFIESVMKFNDYNWK
jgi:hypothetical protein